MLRLNRFKYVAVESVGQARALLMQHGPEATLMSGGTDVLINIKHRLATPRYLIAIGRLPVLQGITRESDGGLTIGAAVTLARLENYLNAHGLHPSLAYSVHLISTPQVRAVGTLGGNACLDVRCNYYNQSHEWRKGIGFCLKKDSPICRVAPGGDRCWAVSSADSVPVLIALRAEVSVEGGAGVRRMPFEKLYQDDGLVPLTLSPGEIVTAIHVPPPEGYACVYQKFRIRHSFDFPLVGVATALRRTPDGNVEDVRIVMTAVASFPERAASAERAMIGFPLDPETISAAGQAVFRQAKPMDNTAGTIFHRKRMARVLTERALREIAGLQEPIRNTA
jgi:4-hydroxybenzoyl-CoA reductase subunit beta